MEQVQKKEILFNVSLEWLQYEAKKIIKRELNNDEVYSAKKIIENGLCESMDIVFKSAIMEALRINDPGK